MNPTYRWSPEPAPFAVPMRTWNLIWLTWPGPPTDRTNGDLMAVDATIMAELRGAGGSWKHTGARLADIPARHAAHLLCMAVNNPLVRRMGPGIREVWVERARLARPDHPDDLNLLIDYNPEDLLAAQKVLARFHTRA